MSSPQPHVNVRSVRKRQEERCGGRAEGARGETQVHEQGAEQLPAELSLPGDPDNTCCFSSLALGQSLFLVHFPSPSVSPCSWLVLAGVLPLADQDWLALPAHLGHCPQMRSLHKMEVLVFILVRLSETRYKPGMLEMSMNQERRKYSSVMKA